MALKKAVRLDFLDFSTLAQRAHFCQEELRLNRRFAPALYLEVLPVTGSPAANAAPLSTTAWSSTSNNGCRAYTP